jgi:hypothetical protein
MKRLDQAVRNSYAGAAGKTGGRKRKAMADPELDSFKTTISLPEYLASLGYAIDKRKSSRGSLVMRKEHVKLIISRRPDGHFTYWNPHDDRDHGTIIDFLQRRGGGNLGQIKKTLRAWTGTPTPARPWLPELQSTPKDRASVQARFAAMRKAHRHPYLENERGIPASVLQFWRFEGRIKIDGHQNSVFPHFDAEGLCGFELKNHDFTGFSTAGSKGLWLSKAIAEDNRLVICESAIEALSFYVLFPDGRTRFASIGGKMNKAQPALIRAQIGLMPEGSEIIAAMNNDDPGRALAEVVKKEFEASGRRDLTFSRQEPEGVNDWNDLLKARPKSPLPCRHEEPSVA